MMTCVARPCPPLYWCRLIGKCALRSVFRSSRSSLWFCHPKNWSPSRTSLWSSKVWNGRDAVVVGTVSVSLCHGWGGLFDCVPSSLVVWTVSLRHIVTGSIRFSLRWNLWARKSPHALHRASRKFPNVAFETVWRFWPLWLGFLCHRWCRQFGCVPLSQVVQTVWLWPFVTGSAVWLCSFGYVPLSQVVQTVWLCPFVTGAVDSLVMSLCHRWLCPIVTGAVDRDCVRLWTVIGSLCGWWLCPFVTGGVGSLCPFVAGDVDCLVVSFCHFGGLDSDCVSLSLRYCILLFLITENIY